MLQFFVLFPLSPCAAHALHGWWRGVSPLLFPLVLPVVLLIVVLQMVSTLLGVATLLLVSCF